MAAFMNFDCRTAASSGMTEISTPVLTEVHGGVPTISYFRAQIPQGSLHIHYKFDEDSRKLRVLRTGVAKQACDLYSRAPSIAYLPLRLWHQLRLSIGLTTAAMPIAR